MVGSLDQCLDVSPFIHKSIYPFILSILAGGQMEEGPLLPKLRGYFAEFLREVSLARLSLFDSPTCVGLRYGQLGERLEAFLGTLSGDTLWGDPSAQHSIA